MDREREFDLILYGATGFVGRLTARYLAGAAPAGARIALAGRSEQKLRGVHAELGAGARDWQVLTADATDAQSLQQMAARTAVVVTTVGPYAKHGVALVEACVTAGTDYADLTGEPLFVRESIERCHERAQHSGARIVHSCGFDSVPSDLSVYLLYRRALADDAGELGVTTLVAAMRGGMSGGTIASGRAQMEAIAADGSLGEVVADPYVLSPDRALEPELGAQSDAALRRADTIDASLHGWVTSFIMAPHNTRIVRRSNGLLGWAYGKNFRYSEVMSTGGSVWSPLLATAIAGGLQAMNVLGPIVSRGVGRTLLDRISPKAGTGPSEQARDNGYFTMKTFARTSSGAKYLATFSAQGDPGYKATAVILGECGLALAFDRAEQPELAGVLTPAPVLGEPLALRLRAAGMTIIVEAHR